MFWVVKSLYQGVKAKMVLSAFK